MSIYLVVAAAVYLVAVLIVTELAKRHIWWLDPEKGWRSLVTSWIVGVFVLAAMLGVTCGLGAVFPWIPRPTLLQCIAWFMVLTGALNVGYKAFAPFREWVRSKV